MKGAKELAEHCREEAARQFGYFGAEEHRSFLSDIAAHLDAKAAIDSAVPVEVGEIAYRHATAEGYLAQHGELARPYGNEAHRNRATLLAIVQRQAGGFAEYRRHAEADTATLNDARIAARAEVERLKLEVAALKAERNHLATTRMESSAEVDRLQTERTALAQENARLINEVGELDATAREQRQLAEVLARGIVAYRTGSFTLAQVWENEEGKAVPR